jgi:hypothetical protein
VPDWSRAINLTEFQKTSDVNSPTSEPLYCANDKNFVGPSVQMPVPSDTSLLSLSGVNVSSVASVHRRLWQGDHIGLLGYGLDTADVGDELWILKGGKVPYVLRPKAMTVPSVDLVTGEANDLPVDIGMPTYELVCEAFVLGLMDGEIIDMLGENPKRERPPPIADMDRDFRTIGLK